MSEDRLRISWWPRVTTVFVEESSPPNEVEKDSVLVANVTMDNLVVAKHSEELRVIDNMIQGVKVTATVDDGSQIISIQQDKWEKIGLPIRSDRIMVMDSANKSKNKLWASCRTSRWTLVNMISAFKSKWSATRHTKCYWEDHSLRWCKHLTNILTTGNLNLPCMIPTLEIRSPFWPEPGTVSTSRIFANQWFHKRR